MKKFPDIWTKCSVNDENFYPKLHEFFQNKYHRDEYNRLAQSIRKRGRLISLSECIIGYYSKRLLNDNGDISYSEFKLMLNTYPGVEDLIEGMDEVAETAELSTMVWALADGDHIDSAFAERMQIRILAMHDYIEDFPHVESDDTAELASSEWKGVVKTFQITANRIDLSKPDIILISQLEVLLGKLKDLTEEIQLEFWNEIEVLFSNYRELIVDSKELTSIIAMISDPEMWRPLPDDYGSLIPKIAASLAEFETASDEREKFASLMTSAPHEDLPGLFEKISQASVKQSAAVEAMRDVLARIVKPAAADPVTEDGSVVADAAGVLAERAVPEDELPLNPPGSQGPGPAVSRSRVIGRTIADWRKSQTGGDAASDAARSAKTVVEEQAGVGALGQSRVSDDGEGSDGDGSLEDAEEAEAEQPEATESGELTGREALVDAPDVVPPLMTRDFTAANEIVASQRLRDDFLIEGRFGLAYWVARHGGDMNASLVGLLCEGALVRPDHACSSILAQFLDELADPAGFSEDETLLFHTALLQPLLFLEPLPDRLYLLAGDRSVFENPVASLFEAVRQGVIYQGISLGPEHIRTDKERVGVETRLQHLAERAGDFMVRLPSIRFGYQPAENALRSLYESGSPLARLHEIIATQQVSRVRDVKTLFEKFKPEDQIASLNQSGSGRPVIVGHNRLKLIKHLDDSKTIAAQWIALVERRDAQGANGRKRPADELRQQVSTKILEVRAWLETREGTAVHAAADRLLAGLLELLNGGAPDCPESVAEACIELPGISLDEEMMPVQPDDAAILDAIRGLADGGRRPEDVLAECLERDELVRAGRLIDRCGLGAGALANLERHRETRVQALRRRLEGIPQKVEEAYLLGQLYDQEQQVANRSSLLASVNEALAGLDAETSLLNASIRETATLVDRIEARMTDMAEKRAAKLENEKLSVGRKFPQTAQGRTDRAYFEASFTECLNQQDHVAAFDLLDRAKESIEKGVEIARTASIQSSEQLERFLARAEAYRTALARVALTKRHFDSITEGRTVFDIPFGEVDAALRAEVVRALEAWRVLRSGKPADVETICRFVGFSVRPGRAIRRESGRQNVLHFQIEIEASRVSPLPGFGSALESTLNVLVCLSSLGPEQVTEVLDQRKILGKGTLVLLGRPVSADYRMKWLRECVKSRSMALPLDTCLLWHLCGEQNRLLALFRIALPFTWAQPYITKGETVAHEMFVGRTEEALDIVDPTGSCIVFGGRQLGKSALLTHVRRTWHDAGNGHYIAYLDINDLGDPQDHKEMTQTFWGRVAEHLAAIGAIPSIRNRRSPTAAPDAIAAGLKADRGKRIILLLDETDNFLDLDSEQDFHLVRRLRGLMADTERRFKVVLAGLQSVQRYKSWQNHPFAQLGSEIVINPLAPKAAEELILRPFRALGFEFESVGLVCRILSMANYHPGLIQIFCFRLLNNLYRNMPQWRGPQRTVTADDIWTIETDASFQEEVRNRFDWTLDLDHRYKVIVSGLVLSSSPTTPRTIQEFRSLGIEWWQPVFGRMDVSAMRALLDEMVGLGVLVTETGSGDFVRRYRLRSPNLLRLLGPKEAIDEELQSIIEHEGVRRRSPREFRARIETPACFGPMTREQEARVADLSEYFSVTLIQGAPSAGLERVAAQTRKIMSDLAGRHGNGNAESTWEEVTVASGSLTAERCIDMLRARMRPRNRNHLYAILNFDEIAFEGDVGIFLKTLIKDLAGSCASRSQGKLIVILGPRWVWEWVRNPERARIEELARVSAMTLRRWSGEAIGNALDQIELRRGSKTASDGILRTTAGVDQLVSRTLEQAGKNGGNAASAVPAIAENVRNELTGAGGLSLLSDIGIDADLALGQAVTQLFRVSSGNADDAFLTDASYALAGEYFEEGTEARTLLKDMRADIQAWLLALDLVWPVDGRKDELRMCSWASTIVNSL